jgi:lysophospholipase L1-like esterase
MTDAGSLLLFASLPAGSGALLWWFAKSVQSRPANSRWSRLLAGNALVLLFLSSLIFLSGEIYFRFSEETDGGELTHASRRWAARYYARNAQGFRDNVDYQLPLPPGRRRVTFCGDSFTVGWGVKDVNNRFANLIRQANPHWDVQVQAQEGLSTQEEHNNLKRVRAMGCQFDLVVLVYVPNDAEDLVSDKLFVDTGAEHWAVRHSDFINTLYYRIKTGYDPNLRAYVRSYQSPYWERHTAHLTALRDFVEANGGHLLVVTFPFVSAPLDQTYEYRFAHRQLDQFWNTLGVPHLDLLPLFEKYSPRQLRVNRFDGHPNEFAHRLAADAIQKFLAENVPALPQKTR